MDQYLLPYGGELAYYFSKWSNAPWLAGGGWAQLELTDTLEVDELTLIIGVQENKWSYSTQYSRKVYSLQQSSILKWAEP